MTVTVLPANSEITKLLKEITKISFSNTHTYTDYCFYYININYIFNRN